MGYQTRYVKRRRKVKDTIHVARDDARALTELSQSITEIRRNKRRVQHKGWTYCFLKLNEEAQLMIAKHVVNQAVNSAAERQFSLWDQECSHQCRDAVHVIRVEKRPWERYIN